MIIMSGVQELIFTDQQGQRPGSPLHDANNENKTERHERLKNFSNLLCTLVEVTCLVLV